MKWNYLCPACGELRQIEWTDREEIHICHKTQKEYRPPTPSQQHDAYVDEQATPPEMEAVVRQLKGEKCTVPGCTQRADTLDHREAYSTGGPTSVNNLFPMCDNHNKEKGATPYWKWLCSKLSGRDLPRRRF